MKINSSFILLLSMCAFSSCKIQDLEYKRIENLKFSLNNSAPEVKFDIICFNPNTVGCRVKDMSCHVINNNDTIAYAFSNNRLRINPNIEVKIPVTSYVSPTSILKLGSKSLFGGTDIPIQLSGVITIEKFIFKKKYRYNVNEKINSRQLFQ